MERQRRKSERGIGLVATAVWIIAFAIIMAAAVDMARLSHTASEVQVIADAAALSGARALYLNGGTPGPEQDAAWGVAHQNSFDGKIFPASNDATGSMIVDAG